MPIITFLIWLAVLALFIYVVITVVVKVLEADARMQQLLYLIGFLILLGYCVMYFPVSFPFPPKER